MIEISVNLFSHQKIHQSIILVMVSKGGQLKISCIIAAIICIIQSLLYTVAFIILTPEIIKSKDSSSHDPMFILTPFSFVSVIVSNNPQLKLIVLPFLVGMMLNYFFGYWLAVMAIVGVLKVRLHLKENRLYEIK